MHLNLIALMSLAYLVGAIPFGLLLTKWVTGADPRQDGSGNIGATNVGRVAGKPLGVATLLLDMAKGAAPTALAIWLLDQDWQVGLVALCAFLGHVFPLYLRFKGGKGVATALGAFGALSPFSFGCILAVLVLGVWLSGHMSVGSLAGWTTAPLWIWLSGFSALMVGISAVFSGLIYWTHRANLARLRAGREHSWR